MNYRDKFYSRYISGHTASLYGEVSLGKIRKQFPVWLGQYGRMLPKDKSVKVLDLGCGNGAFVYWLQSMGFANTQGIDISEEQVDLAKQLEIKNIKLGDFREFLKTKENSYDLIVARDLLEHFTKQEVFDSLGIIFAALKPSGIFLVQTVNAENIFWGRIRYGDFTHETAFTESSIRQLLRTIGFESIEIYPQPPVAHGFKSAIRLLIWKIFELTAHFYLLVEAGSGKGIFTSNIIGVARKPA